MKKYIGIITVVGLSIISLFLLMSGESNKKQATIEQQLLDEMKNKNIEVEKIVHLEVVKDGIVVFYAKDQNLYDAFIQLKGGKWEWYFGSGALPFVADTELIQGGTNFDEFFVHFGIITDDQIKQVKEKETGELAKIVQNEEGIRIYIFINQLKKLENGRYEPPVLIPVYDN